MHKVLSTQRYIFKATRIPTSAPRYSSHNKGSTTTVSISITTKAVVRRNFASASDKKCCTGVDEAGLGPILGPLAVVRVSVATDNPDGINDLFKNSNSGIGDSKNVHTNWDLAPIESIALGGLAWVTGGKVPSNANELFSLLGEKPEDRNLPWMAGAEDLKLPITTTSVAKWNVPGVEPVGFDGVIVHPSTLNTLRRNGVNKANLEVQYIGKILQSLPEVYKEHYIDIDRLGGRVYYGDVLQQFWNNATVEVVEEVRNRSAYTAHSADTGMKRFVQFLVAGEDQSALIALSSCMAKYIREVHMLLFNTYWQNKFPGLLKSTTGYFTDATIWIRRVNKLDPTVLPPIMEDLIRAGSSKKFSPW